MPSLLYTLTLFPDPSIASFNPFLEELVPEVMRIFSKKYKIFLATAVHLSGKKHPICTQELNSASEYRSEER